MDQKPTEIIVQGHRGCRGLLPENTMEAFLHATKMGVSTLEMDVVLSADGRVVVSHEPFMSAEICLTPDLQPIVQEEQMAHNIFEMSADSAKAYDCGAKGNARFPDQKPMVGAHKPLLTEVVEQVKATCKAEQREVPFFNIEIKSRPEWVGIYHPDAEEYVRMFLAALKSLDIDALTTVQSFDPAVLNNLVIEAPALRLVYLSEDAEQHHLSKLAELASKPYGYSVNFEMATSELVSYCRENDIHLSVWTVNEVSDMERMLDLGVRDIITDYPDRLLALTKAKKLVAKTSGVRVR